MKNYIIIFALFLAGAFSGYMFISNEGNNMEDELKEFIKKYEETVIPLSKEANLAYFNATISGKEEDYKKSADLEVRISRIYSDKENFKTIEKIYNSDNVKDPLLKREAEIIYKAYLSKQLDSAKLEDMIRRGNKIENKYSTFRAEVNGKKLTDNEIEETLKTSKDSKTLEAAWKASKKIGGLVAPEVVELVKLRNSAARELGFKNYHEMSLKLSDQDPQEIEKLFDELDNLTRSSFAKLKNEIDESLSKTYGISKDKLMPWHYQNRFFQEAPKIYSVDLDGYYKDKDIVKLTEDYYRSIGLPIEDMVAKSDLYEKEGKYQHAYCTSIDRSGDVRVVCNIKQNYNWMGTSLHEYGHAVYDKWISRDLPWVLREPAHTFTTESIAMLFGRMASNPQWLQDMAGISDAEKEKIKDACYQSLRLEQLTFSRWVQVMYRFEKSMYENPDGDLNKTWWDLVEKYQMLKRPEGRNAPDWASKIHVALYPAYYHNYLLGELLASQFYYYVNENVLDNKDAMYASFKNNKEVGDYFKEKVFKPGAKYQWNDMIEKATGEKLTAKYYAKQFVN